jgi:hypothetical protein
MGYQTSVESAPSKAYPGMEAYAEWNKKITGICEATESYPLEPGLVVMRGAGGDMTARVPPAVAADADALKTNIGSTAGVQTFTGADFNGVIGTGRISPPARLDLILSSHANWDATSATIIYEDEHGVRQTESLAIPDGGGATVSTTGYASRIVSLAIPAQAGTSGTATLGVSATRTLAGGDVLGVAVRTHKGLVAPASDDNEVYEDGSELPILKEGFVYVLCENAYEAGDRPLVRVVATGAEKLGACRVGDTDSGDCIAWPDARFESSGSAGTYGLLYVDKL